jgi:DnaK suppressor protein
MAKSMKNTLLKMREELLRELLNNRKAESSDPKTEIGDLYDLADEERDRQLSLLLSDRDREKLFEIDAALERIDEKTYGVCEECGKKISSNRLKIMPFARLCVPCQSGFEKNQRTRRFEEEPTFRDLSYTDTEESED